MSILIRPHWVVQMIELQAAPNENIHTTAVTMEKSIQYEYGDYGMIWPRCFSLVKNSYQTVRHPVILHMKPCGVPVEGARYVVQAPRYPGQGVC